MGFYGNITNTSKTNFVFDKIYTNRKAMDSNINKDGIFIGRYVLVEYGEITEDSFIRAYGPQADGYYHISNDNEVTTRILYTTEPIPSKDNYIKKGQIIYVLGIGGKYEFLECNGGANKGKPSFSDEPGLDPKTDPYFYNLKQDQAAYNVSRGYDGTVWVKTSINNEIKYVNIAELNSVVPSFEMVADAPTMSPILPHFDTASNNVYYKLHWQPAWGMRVAETADGSNRFSDYVTSWSQEVYDKESGEAYTKWYFPNELQEDGRTKGVWRSLNTGEQPPTINADIYFNHAAFDSQIGETNINKTVETNKAIYKPITLTAETYKKNKYYYKTGSNYFLDSRPFNVNRTYYEKLENYIGITADGLSGNKYNLHDGTSNTKPQVDTQQIHINLPAIGNMMSEAWDIIHGEKRDNTRTDEDGGSLQGRLDSFMAFYDNQIPIKNENGTIVGSKINGAQPYDSDWEEKPIEVLYDNTEPGFERDDAWIKTEINANGLKTGDKGGSNDQVDNSGISIHHTFHSTKDTKATLDKNSGTQTLTHIDDTTVDENKKDKIPVLNKSDKETGKEDTIKLYTPYVDAKGHVIGKNIETITLPYGYKKIEVKNSTSKNNALYTVTDTPTADNTQDTLKLEASNKWIKLSTTDSATENKVTFGHKYSDFVNGTAANTYYGLTQNEDHTSNLNMDNKFEVPCLKFDEAGHIIEAKTHTVTLPELFTKVNIGDANTTTGLNEGETTTTHTKGSLEADTMTDEFTIKPGNKWIQMTADENNDAFSIQHYVNKFTESTGAINYNTATTKTFNIQNIGWDEAGHLISSAKTTYTLPDGFKTIAIANNGSSTTTFSTASNASLIAETLTDTATIDTGNRWLTLVADANNDKVTLSHAAAGNASTSKNLQSDNNTSPNFGDSFKVLTAGIDQAGHVKDLGDYSITLPTPSLSTGSAEATDSSVITGIVLTDNTTGAFTKSTANVGTLKLTDYSDDTGDLTSKTLQITSNDTINSGLKTIQNYINSLDESDNEKKVTKYVSSVTQKDGKISVTHAGTETLQISGYNSDTTDNKKIYDGNTINGAFKKLEDRIIAEEENRKNAIKGLDSSKSADANKYISGITITDGKITSIQQTALGSAAYKNEEYFAKAEQGSKADSAIQPNTTFAYGTEQKTIQELMNIVATQAATIEDLIKRIEALEKSIITE